MDVVGRTLYNIIGKKKSFSIRGGGKKLKEQDESEGIMEEAPEILYDIYKYDHITKKGMPVRQGGKIIRKSEWCGKCGHAYSYHTLGNRRDHSSNACAKNSCQCEGFAPGYPGNKKNRMWG